MMRTPSLALVSALILIGAAGFIAGRVSSGDAAATEAAAGPQATRSAMRPAGQSTAAEQASARVRQAAIDDPVANSPAARLTRLESIVRGENPIDRNRALLAFIDQLAPGDFEAAVAHFRGLGLTESRMGEYSLLLSAWAKTDPMAALDYARANTTNRFATDTILTTWASQDADAALRWAEANHTGEGANPHLAGVIRGLAAGDPQRATLLLTGMPRSVERGRALDAMLPFLLAQGNDATRAWIGGLADEALRNGAMMRTAERLAVKDPAGTVDWLLANPGEAADRRMDDVFNTWARSDEQAATRSLASLPAGEARSDALRGAVSGVAVKDPAKAVSLMDRFTSDVDDRVVRNFIWNAFDTDPATAVGQIARMSDEGYREMMYRRTLGRWIQRDAEAAGAWMRANPVPDSVVQQLRQR